MSRKLVLVFIGYKGHWADGIAPIVGECAKKLSNIPIYFCNQQEIKKTYKELLKYNREEYQIIAFDVGICKGNEKYAFQQGIKPASLIKEEQDIILGEVGVIINVNSIATIDDFTININKTPSRKLLKKRNKIIKSTLKNVQGLIKVSEEENVL